MIYINKITNRRPIEERTEYPYNIPAIRSLDEFEFNSNVTFIIGENGSGKSTFVEAIAVCAGFNPEGGSTYLNYRTYDTHSSLFNDFKLTRSGRRNKDGYFLRAESFYNVASEIDRISDGWQLEKNYGGPLHKRSHGESFLGVILNRLSGDGLYIFDEPESALSIASLFKLIVKMNELEKLNSQFIIATHSPILLAYPGAEIYAVTDNGLELMKYEDTEQYILTKYFISNHTQIINELLNNDQL
ncbi:MAG: AAA family ATPase [Bacteroidales bacterium]